MPGLAAARALPPSALALLRLWLPCWLSSAPMPLPWARGGPGSGGGPEEAAMAKRPLACCSCLLCFSASARTQAWRCLAKAEAEKQCQLSKPAERCGGAPFPPQALREEAAGAAWWLPFVPCSPAQQLATAALRAS